MDELTAEEASAKHEQEMHTGQQTRALMENQALQNALTTIREGFEKTWRDSNIRDSEGREECYRMLKCLDLFEKQLTHVLESGKMAAISETLRQESTQRSDALKDWDGSASTHPRDNSRN